MTVTYLRLSSGPNLVDSSSRQFYESLSKKFSLQRLIFKEPSCSLEKNAPRFQGLSLSSSSGVMTLFLALSLLATTNENLEAVDKMRINCVLVF